MAYGKMQVFYARCPQPPQTEGMTHAEPRTWCDRLQAKLMAAIDAAWETISTSDDPAVIKRARERARACGEVAAQARKIAAMTPVAKPMRPSSGVSLPALPLPTAESAAETPPARAIHRLKGGGRARL